MDTKVILYLAAFNALAPGAYAAPAPPNAIPQLNQPERRDPQFLGLPGINPQFAPLAAATVASTVAATAVSVNNPVNSLLNAVGTALKTDIPAAASTAIALPKELVSPVTNALMQDPITAMQLAMTSIMNAILGGKTTLFGGGLSAPLNVDPGKLTNSLTDILGGLLSSKASAAGGGSLRKREGGEADGVVDEGSSSDAEKRGGFDTEEDSCSDTEDSGSDTDGESSGSDTEDKHVGSAPIIVGAGPHKGAKMEKRQVLPNTLITVPSAAVVPSGVSDTVAVIGSFAPLADATPLAVVPTSMAALAPDGTPASAVVPAVLVSAFADPDNNSLASIGTIDQMAPLPTELVPSSAAAAIAAAASELPTPIKRKMAEIAESNGLQVRQVEDLKQGLDTATDPAAFVAQFFAAQAKPIMNELSNQLQAAPSVLANIAAAQASNLAAPASIVAAQVSAAKPIIDAVPSVIQSQLEALPTAALPVFSAASSILDNLGNATVGTVNPLAAIVPDATAIASIIAEALPDVSLTLDPAALQATPTDSGAIVALTGGALVSDIASVAQNFGVTPVGPQFAVASVTAVPTVYPTVGLPISLQLPNVLQTLSPLVQLLSSRVQRPSTLITQPSSLAQPYATPLQQYRSSIQQHPPLQSLSQLVPSLSRQRIPSAPPYTSAAIQNQDTNSAIGRLNGVIMAEIATTAVPTTPSTLPIVSEIPTTLLPEEPTNDDDASGASASNNIVNLLTRPLSPDGISSLLENQMFNVQLAPLLLMVQSLATLSSDPSTFTLSSSLLRDLLGSSSSSSLSSSSSNPANRILDLLRPASSASSSSDPTQSTTSPLSSSSSYSSSSPTTDDAVDDPIASAWLAGAKLLQSNSLVNTRLMSPPDGAVNNNNNNNSGGGASATGGGGAIVANLLNMLLSSSASAELTRTLARKMSALVKWSADTQVAATRLGIDAWEELADVLVS